jgi:hypothetical protein
MTIKELKKELRKEREELGDKIRFGRFDGDRLEAIITRENGEKQKVYYKFEGGQLASSWYYLL